MTRFEFIESLKKKLQKAGLSEEKISKMIEKAQEKIDRLLKKGNSFEDIANEWGNDHLYDFKQWVTKPHNKWIQVLPFLTIIFYFIVGNEFNAWHPAWLIFTLIPFVRLIQKNVSILLLLSIVIVTLYIAFLMPNSVPLYFGLAALWIVAGNVRFSFLNYMNQDILNLTIFITMLYVGIGLIWTLWTPTWLLFLFIPLYRIYKKRGFQLMSMMPFISIVLFFIIGEVFNRYNYAWLAFLLIPIVGILSKK
jgi:hypothetical protein